jgi:hypothetical protein
MKLIISIPAAIALAATIYTPSLADCVDVTGSVNKDQHVGMAKDGTHAPLEGKSGSQVQTQSATGTTTTSAEAMAKAPQKEGGTLPMGESSSLATSPQDATAQQKGDRTAAATAAQGKCD